MSEIATGEWVYEVWGGYEGQEDGDFWAAFPCTEEAEVYCEEQMAENPRLTLHVSRRWFAE